MDNLIVDKIEDLSIEGMRYMLKAEAERIKLLCKYNNFILYRYEVAEDSMIILFSPDDKLEHKVFRHYSEEHGDHFFEKREHSHLVQILKQIIHDPNHAKKGTEELVFKNGTRVLCEYSCLMNEDNTIKSVVGQCMNVLQSNDSVETLKMLNREAEVNDALHLSFETIIKIDLTDFTFEVIKGSPEVESAAKTCSNVLDLGNIFCQYYVETEYQTRFMEFISEMSIKNRLEENRFMVFEYMTKNIGMCRARIVPGRINSSGDLLEALFVTERSGERSDEIAVLRVAATTDSLTGLLNRRAGTKAITEKLEKADGGVFVIFDCDNFKSINDTLGHPVGDKCLIEVSNSLRSAFPGEIIVRIGGDEFVMFVSSRNLVGQALFEGIEVMLAPLQEKLSQVNIKEMNGKKLKMSAGAVIIPAGVKAIYDDVYRLSDKILYEAKVSHNGGMRSFTLENNI